MLADAKSIGAPVLDQAGAAPNDSEHVGSQGKSAGN